MAAIDLAMWFLALFPKIKKTNVEAFVFSMPTRFYLILLYSWILLLSIPCSHLVYECLIALTSLVVVV